MLDSGPAWTSPNNVVGGGGPGGGGGSGSEDTLEMNDEMMDVNERMMDGSPVGGDGSNTARRTPPGDVRDRPILIAFPNTCVFATYYLCV